MRSIVSRSADPTRLRADLVVAVTPDPPDPAVPPLAALDAASGHLVTRAVEDGEVTGEAGGVWVFHVRDGLAAPRVGVAGLGPEPGMDAWRRAGAAVAGRAAELRLRRVALALPAGAGGREAAWFIEGAGVAARRFDRFRSAPAGRPPVPLEEVVVAGGGVRAADARRADAVVAAVNGARDLTDTPANHLTPAILAEHAQRLAAGLPGLECTVLGERQLRRLGAGALLGVARGTDEPPAMIVLRHRPARPARRGEVLGLVGKAVTFDTGGISIKPSQGMEEMKMDMAGGAAVIEGTALIARLGLPVEVLAVVPATENMPGPRALKPGDVVTAMNGTTIEVVNTDAEGRLILADGLAYAVAQGATRLLDLATLTGAIVVALGEVYAGLFGSDDAWTAEVRAAAEESGDLAWPLPLHPGYDPLVRSEVADLSNSAKKRQAGAVYAARFLRDFTGGLPWCHLDIAGTGMVDGRGTGFGVRLIAALAARMSHRA